MGTSILISFDEVHYRNIGDLRVAPISLGSVKFGRNTNVKYPKPFDLPSKEQTEKLVSVAQDLGINLIDTAPAYGSSELRIGELLKGRRQNWLISTKVGEIYDGESHYDFSAPHVRRSIYHSLQQLQTDYLDIALIHCSDDDLKDLKTTDAITEILKLQTDGYIRKVGASTKTLSGSLFALEAMDVVMVEADELGEWGKAATTTGPLMIKKALQSGHSKNFFEGIRSVLSYSQVSTVVVGTINEKHLIENVENAINAV
jgi:aryl-alcohol dehydrogenase-like predicted oxidoreductase